MLQENILKEAPRLNKKIHRLLNIRWRNLRSPMPDEQPAFTSGFQ